MIAYIIISYLVMLGMIINSHDNVKDVNGITIFTFLLSPITLPIIIGMMMSHKD